MRERAPHSKQAISLAGLLAATMLAATQSGANQGATPSPSTAPAIAAIAPEGAPTHKVSPYRPLGGPDSAQTYYQSVWGIDNLLVRQTASGTLIRFSYRVTDPARAKPLGDKEVTPYLVGVRSHVVLQIPVLEQVGPLRQTGVSQPGQKFWMVFSNKGGPVRVGDRVNVIIGSFHADGLVVE